MLLTIEGTQVTSTTSGSNPWLHRPEVDLLPWTSWSLPALKKHWICDFDTVREMTSDRSGNLTDLQEELLPCAAAFTRTWVNQRGSPVQRLGCMQEITSYNGQWGSPFYLRKFLCRREEELSAPRISLFWKHSFVSLSLLDVFFFCCCVDFCLVLGFVACFRY